MKHHTNGTTDAARPSRGNGRGVRSPDRAAAVPPAQGEAKRDIDTREQRLFQSLDLDNDQQVLRSDLVNAFAEVGLRADDHRLSESMAALDAFLRHARAAEEERPEPQIPRDRFCQAIRHNILLIERALQGNIIIPDFSDFSQAIRAIYEETRENRSGQPATYIPQLDLREPDVDRYGVALCTIDGQRLAVGDADVFFTVQSTSKPILYALALEEHGAERVHAHVGHEPSGARFNELTLDRQSRPHNPMINAGAIMSSALIRLKDKQERLRRGALTELDERGWAGSRLDYVMGRWQALSGGEKPRFNSPVYLSEQRTADRNFALAYFMRENGAFPDGIDLDDVLDFYFQNCSIELNAEMMSVVAATLANGGINPITGEQVFRPETVRHVLSLMSSCGMYDFSGEFAFTIGLPAKSGVSGAMLIVIPNVLGICTWSPRLDAHGNSVRGIDFSRRLVETFNFHNYDAVTGVSGKRDPRLSRVRQQAAQVDELIWAASKGDLSAIQQQVWRGVALNGADYDRRTPLHLAAAEGQAHVVRFFIDQMQNPGARIDLNPRDRWGGTPLDDAYNHGHDGVVEMLERAGGVRGHPGLPAPERPSPRPGTALPVDSTATTELIWAASAGDHWAIRRLVARGIPLGVADYDLRTPLHLAAAEGHVRVVEYLLAHRVDVNPLDRWGHTPLDDALRHGRADVAALLEDADGQPGVEAGPTREKAAAK